MTIATSLCWCQCCCSRRRACVALAYTPIGVPSKVPQIAGIVINILYFPTAVRVLSTFTCQEDLDFLVWAPYLDCTGRIYSTRWVASVLLTIAFVVGYPLTQALALILHRTEHKQIRFQINWRPLLQEKMWLLLCKFVLACVLSSSQQISVPVTIFILLEASMILQVDMHFMPRRCLLLFLEFAHIYLQIKFTPIVLTMEAALKLCLLSALLLTYVCWLIARLDFAGVDSLMVLIATVCQRNHAFIPC